MKQKKAIWLLRSAKRTEIDERSVSGESSESEEISESEDSSENEESSKSEESNQNTDSSDSESDTLLFQMIEHNRKEAIKCKYYINALFTMFDGKSMYVRSNKRISLTKFTSKRKKMHFEEKKRKLLGNFFFSTFFS